MSRWSTEFPGRAQAPENEKADTPGAGDRLKPIPPMGVAVPSHRLSLTSRSRSRARYIITWVEVGHPFLISSGVRADITVTS